MLLVTLCEMICEQRRVDGLHGLAIKYGSVEDVGASENIDRMLSMATVQKQFLFLCFGQIIINKQTVITLWVSLYKFDQGSNVFSCS